MRDLEKERKRKREYWIKNKDKWKNYPSQSGERAREKSRRSYWKRRESELKRGREYRAKNKDLIKKISKNYNDKNKDKVRLKHQIQYGKRRNKYKTTDITTGYLKNLWDSTTHCVICGKILENHGLYPSGKHLDHIIPLIVGGTHTMSNVRYICAACNIARPKDGRDVLLNGVVV